MVRNPVIVPFVLILFFFSSCKTFSIRDDRSTSDLRNEEIVLTPEALRIHRSAIVVDGHNDLPERIRDAGENPLQKLDFSQFQKDFQTDLPRLLQGGVGAQFWSAYAPPEIDKQGGAAHFYLEQIDLIHQFVKKYPGDLEMAYSARDIQRIHKKGKIASLIGIEGGYAIENSLALLRMYYKLGARYMTLTHNKTIAWADSATDDSHHEGLTEFGELVVREMNRLGMLVDISHVSPDTMRDVLRISRAPVIASHSGAYAIAPVQRNVPDDVLQGIAKNGGIVMVVFYSGFVAPEAVKVVEGFNAYRAELEKNTGLTSDEWKKALDAWDREHPTPEGTIRNVADHIDHIAQVAGIDHVGLGSDFDGAPQYPRQLKDVSYFPYITQELLNRGYSYKDIKKILGGNFLRVFQKAEEQSR